MLISAAVDGCRGSPTFVYYLRFTKFPVDQLLAELKYTINEFDLFCYTAVHNNIKVGSDELKAEGRKRDEEDFSLSLT